MKRSLAILAAAFTASLTISLAEAGDHGYEVRLTGMGAVHDPILCQDLATVDLMYQWSVAHLRDQMANAISHGSFGRAYGTSSQAPLKLYGCISVPNGTIASVMPGYRPDDLTAWLTVDLPGNTIYTGVTDMRELRAYDRGPPAQ